MPDITTDNIAIILLVCAVVALWRSAREREKDYIEVCKQSGTVGEGWSAVVESLEASLSAAVSEQSARIDELSSSVNTLNEIISKARRKP